MAGQTLIYTPPSTTDPATWVRQFGPQFQNIIAQVNASLNKLSPQTTDGGGVVTATGDGFYAARFHLDDWVNEYDGTYSVLFAHNLATSNLVVELWRESFDETVRIEPRRLERVNSNSVKIYMLAGDIFAGRIVILAKKTSDEGGIGGSGTGSGSGSGGSGETFNPTDTLQLFAPMELPFTWNNTGTLRMTYLASKELTIHVGYQVLGGTDPNNLILYKADATFVYGAKLYGNYSADTFSVDDGGFVIQPVNDTVFAEFYNYGSVTRDQLYERRRLALIGNEIMAIQSIAKVNQSPARYRITGIIRGLYDTKPSAHLNGAAVFCLLEDEQPFTILPQTGFANGVTITTKAIPYTLTQTGTPAGIGSTAMTLRSRAARTYGPHSLRIDDMGAVHGPTYTEGVAFRASWQARNRQYTDALADFLAKNAILESGQDFVVRVYDDAENLLSETTVAATDTFTDGFGVRRWFLDVTIPALSGYDYVVVTVNSRRNGLEHLDVLNEQSITVTRAA
jgi:hypothetical protein